MSKELPPELRPHLVPNTGAAAVAEAHTLLAEAETVGAAWLLITTTDAGDVTTIGTCDTARNAEIIMLAAFEAWAATADAVGNPKPRQLYEVFLRARGVRTEYVSGGTVPRVS